ncbi:YjcG family protein [Bacillus pinisoli]|uniref:YjcG family protein n=1 Tax=Bacillus pinisoli TaxID=2901866 RepID=UPI001FF38551|nr:YjcG family protein [Bacillus pinisoli]
MKYGIAIFPSKKLQDYANSFRKRYDPSYALISPHITLKSGFEVEENQVEAIVQELHKIASEVKAFKVNVYKVSSFHPVNNVIYFGVEAKPELEVLHNKMHEGILSTDREYAYVPHITIAQNLSDDEHSDVLSSLKMTKVNYEETVDRFQLLYQLENGSWTVHETFHLGKEC